MKSRKDIHQCFLAFVYFGTAKFTRAIRYLLPTAVLVPVWCAAQVTFETVATSDPEKQYFVPGPQVPNPTKGILLPADPQHPQAERFHFTSLGKAPSQNSSDPGQGNILFTCQGARENSSTIIVQALCKTFFDASGTRKIESPPIAFDGTAVNGLPVGPLTDSMSYRGTVYAFRSMNQVLWGNIDTGVLEYLGSGGLTVPSIDQGNIYYVSGGPVYKRAPNSAAVVVMLNTFLNPTSCGVEASGGNLGVFASADSTLVSTFIGGTLFVAANNNTPDRSSLDQNLQCNKPDCRFKLFDTTSSSVSATPGFQNSVVSFQAVGQDGTVGIYYVDMTAPTAPKLDQIIADSTMIIPGTSDRFELFDSQTCVDNGRVAFIGGVKNPNGTWKHRGIYIRSFTDAQLTLVVDVSTRSLDFGIGQMTHDLADLDMGHEALVGNRLAFWAQYDTTHSGIFVSTLGQFNQVPTVSITATDPSATESGHPGTFTISRTGNTSSTLTVNFSLAGPAVNGIDYQTLGTSATIPAGASSITITVRPIDNCIIGGSKTVICTLAPSPSYTVGPQNTAAITITEDDQSAECTAMCFTPLIDIQTANSKQLRISCNVLNASQTPRSGTIQIISGDGTVLSSTTYNNVGPGIATGTDVTRLSGSTSITLIYAKISVDGQSSGIRANLILTDPQGNTLLSVDAR